MKSFQSKIVWITGASSGIGKALAHEVAARGAKCMLTARNVDTLSKLREEISQTGGTAFVYPGDVTDLKLMQDVVHEIEADHGPIDMLVANAGDNIFTKPEQFDTEEYMYLMNLNYGGVLRCIEAVLKGMIQRKEGHIVGMASLAGFRGLPRAAAYGASKAAIIHFLESAWFHLRRLNVKVTIVNPGFVRTPLTDKNDFHMPFLTEPKKAAKIICDGLQKEKKEISFPIPFNWILKTVRIIPYALYDFIIEQIWKRQEAAKA
ncbi:SDR family NAD(P)-dependent oxidoreductase [Oligoflexia bacterium]|nr:SDR family NAD(P)-dependent oxidoreductase [Oligoflexia bacterium]